MKKFASLSLFAVLFVGTLASAQCPSGCLFYGGDFDPNNPNANGLANENDAIVGGNPYGAATYQNLKANHCVILAAWAAKGHHQFGSGMQGRSAANARLLFLLLIKEASGSANDAPE